MSDRAVGTAAAAALLSMATVFVLKTYADAVFLAEYGVAYLPHFYIAQAAALITSAGAYSRLIRRGAARIDAVLLLAVVAAGVLAPLLDELGGPWVFAVALAVLTLSGLAQLAVWNAATSIRSGRGMRSLLPKIGAAATVGAALGGFGSSAIVSATSLGALGPVGAGLAAIALVLRLALVRRAAPRRSRRPRRSAPRRPDRPSARRLVVLLAAAAIAEAILTQLLDYGFKRDVAASFADADRMGVFLSLFYGAVNLSLLALQLFAASRLLATRALRRTLSTEPALLAVAAATWIAMPGLAAAAAARGLEMVLKFSLGRPAQEVALTPLSDLARQRWKVLLRGGFNQGGAAATGVLLIVLAPAWRAHPAVVPAAALALALGWLLLQRRVAAAYLDTLGIALGARNLSIREQQAASLLDRDGIERVVILAGDDEPTVARFGRELLEHVAAEDPRALLPHLCSPSAPVRRAVYESLAREPSRACQAALRAAAAAETDDEAFGAALTALAALGDDALSARARVLAEGDDPRSAQPAIRSAWIYLALVGALDRGPALREVASATLDRDGLTAARILAGALAREALDETEVDVAVLEAIASEDAERRAAGLNAAAALGRSRPLTRLLEAIEAGEPRAADAVRALDAAAMECLLLLAEARELSPRGHQRLLRVLRSSPLPEAAGYAERALVDADPACRSLAARTLLGLQRDGSYEPPAGLIEQALGQQLDLLERYVAARPGLPAGVRDSSLEVRRKQSLHGLGRDALFADELERATERALSRLCELLALLGNPTSVFAAERALSSPSFEARRQAVDVLQEVTDGAERSRLLPLLESYLLPPRIEVEGALDRACAIDPWLARVRGDGDAELIRRVSALRGSVLFDGIDGEALAALAERATARTVRAGERAAEDDAALYVVLSGSMRIEGEDVGPGETFGELTLVDDEPRAATILCLEDGELLRLPRAAFHEALERERALGLGLVRGLVHWLRRA